MTIKEVSEKYGISQDTLRYYERVNVIPKVTRTSGGILDYQEEDQSPVCLDGRGKRRTFQTADTEPCRPVDRLLQPAQRRGMEQ